MKRPGQSRLRITHVELDEANAFVEEFHRHCDPVAGHKFSIGVEDESGQLRGVAIVGRPNSRMRQDGFTVEVLRVVTGNFPNACSCLYNACIRAAVALGYRRIGTYTKKSEPGASLKAAGWKIIHEVKGREWDTPSRPRKRRGKTEDRFFWEPNGGIMRTIAPEEPTP